jgi:anti-sigma factor (TIGR02949 family)
MEPKPDMTNASTSCARFVSSVDAYIDGELDPDHVVDVEAHLADCNECAERVSLSRSVRVSLQRISSTRASESLRERVCATISQERRREADEAVAAHQVADAQSGTRGMMRLRYAVAFAAAAGVAFAMGLSRVTEPPVGDLASSSSREPARAGSLDSILDELVALHAQPLPPETKNPDELPRFDPLVGVPVRRPAFKPFDATFDGARVHAMRDRRAALLQYTLHNKHRVTVYVFDPKKMPVRESSLQPRRERAVYVGKLRGYSIAAAERSGVGYALASDLDAEESTALMLAAAPLP